MKKLLAFLCLLFVIQFAGAQRIDTGQNTSRQSLHDMYMQKRKTQKLVGWLLLGSGVIMSGTGFYTYWIEQVESTYSGTGETIFYLGIITSLSSIPLFISAGKNKRKAKLALKGETFTIGSKMIPNTNYTALALTIQL